MPVETPRKNFDRRTTVPVAWPPERTRQETLADARINRVTGEIRAWYETHAHEFADADAVELAFVGQSREFQERLNRFKLWAVDREDLVDLEGKRVLELGAGHARLAFAYRAMAAYTGVDTAHNLVALGNARLRDAGLSDRARLFYGDANSFEIPERDFDVVCSLGMMCYIPDPRPVIENMVRYLRPGGTLFYDFRVASPVYSTIRRIKWALHPPTGGKTFVIRPIDAQSMLRECGLVDVRIRLREFPLLAERYAGGGSDWPLSLRNSLADSTLARPFATEAWIFATKPEH